MIRAFWTFEQNTFPIHYAIGTQLDSNLELESSFALQKIMRSYSISNWIPTSSNWINAYISFAHMPTENIKVKPFFYLTHSTT